MNGRLLKKEKLIRTLLIFAGLFFYCYLGAEVIWKGITEVKIIGVSILFPLSLLLAFYLTPVFNGMIEKSLVKMRKESELQTRISLTLNGSILCVVILILVSTIQYSAIMSFLPGFTKYEVMKIPIYVIVIAMVSTIIIRFYIKYINTNLDSKGER